MANPPGQAKSELLAESENDESAKGNAQVASDSPGTVAGLPEVFAEKYRVLGKIGSGGMSTVYKVQHLLMNRILALKVLHQMEEQSVLRFQQEAKASSLLEHPNIVRVHDFGIAGGLPYMTMDYLEGVTLSEFIQPAGAVSLQKIAQLFGQICSALAHAHERGIIHRDLKPSNIIIRKLEDGYEQAIVVDYGIAKIISEAGAAKAHNLTRTGDVFGTPLYMSPEQCQSFAVDARSDIYSLGCVMYESVAGKPPFQANSVYGIIHQQITEAPPPFPEAVRKTKAGRRLQALILKAMAKSPEDRQQHVLELSSELKSIEIGGGGFFSDLVTLAETVSGRMKAAERKSVIMKFLLDVACVVAVVVSVLLVCLPGLIQAYNSEKERNSAIVRNVDAAFFKNMLWNDFPEASRRSENIVETLQRLCKDDQRQEKTCERFARNHKKAMRQTGLLKPTLRKKILESGIGMNTMQVLEDAAETAFTKTLVAWVEANRSGTELIRFSDENLERTGQSLQICWATLVVSFLLAFVLLPGLPILIWRRFLDLRASKLKLAKNLPASSIPEGNSLQAGVEIPESGKKSGTN